MKIKFKYRSAWQTPETSTQASTPCSAPQMILTYVTSTTGKEATSSS